MTIAPTARGPTAAEILALLASMSGTAQSPRLL